jgi:AcrR family transcriptional regulator
MRDQQRSAVTDAVVRLVAEDATTITVAELAEAAGMSRQTFYKYFPTLGAAMLHTHRAALERLRSYVDDRLTAAENSRERLLAVLGLQFEFTLSHPELVRFFSYFDFSFRRAGLTAEERAELHEISRGADMTRQIFVDGQADGSIDAALPVEPTVMAVSGSLIGLAQRLLIQDEYSDGTGARARAAYDVLLASWRTTLIP